MASTFDERELAFWKDDLQKMEKERKEKGDLEHITGRIAFAKAKIAHYEELVGK